MNLKLHILAGVKIVQTALSGRTSVDILHVSSKNVSLYLSRFLAEDALLIKNLIIVNLINVYMYRRPTKIRDSKNRQMIDILSQGKG